MGYVDDTLVSSIFICAKACNIKLFRDVLGKENMISASWEAQLLSSYFCRLGNVTLVTSSRCLFEGIDAILKVIGIMTT